MNELVSLIRSGNSEQEVIMEKKPLLLCMLRGEGFSDQMEVVEAIAKNFSEKLKVGFLHERYIETFSKNYNVRGTLTFLILFQGKEKDRLLGIADQEMLTHFIISYGFSSMMRRSI